MTFYFKENNDYKFIELNGKNKNLLQYMKMVPSCQQLKDKLPNKITIIFSLEHVMIYANI